jgi:hypothetical protein
MRSNLYARDWLPWTSLGRLQLVSPLMGCRQRVCINRSFVRAASIDHPYAREMPQWLGTVVTMMTATEKKWVADRLRKLAAREALTGAHSVAVKHLFRAEAIEAGRDDWRNVSGQLAGAGGIAARHGATSFANAFRTSGRNSASFTQHLGL